VAKALTVRVRFPAWSASVRSRHLSIVICRNSDIRCLRLRTASTKFVRQRGLRGQSRSSTAIERPKRFGRRGFDSHRARQFRRAVEFGLSVKRETASTFKPCTIGQLMDSQLASLSVVSFGMGRCVLSLSNCVAQMRESISYKREDTGSIPVQKHRSRLLPIIYQQNHFRRVAGLGYRLLSAWSLVRVQPSAQHAEVAQW
jgi:hypothetical protein